MKKTTALLIGAICSIYTLFASDTLRVGYNSSPPFVIENETIVEGLNMWLWNHISKESDIEYELIKMPLDSILHNLSTGKIDISINPLTITSERSELIDFTAPYYITHSGILTNSEEEEVILPILSAIGSWKFAKALGALGLVICCFGGALWFVERKRNTEEFQKGIKGFGNGVWWSAVTMTTVGYGDTSPKTFLGKTIAVVWMFVAIMIISGFTAAITSSLTVNDLSADQSDIMSFKNKKIGTVKESHTESWVKHKFFSKVVSFSNAKEAVKALKKGEVEAVAYGAPMLSYLEKQNEDDAFYLLPVQYNAQMYSFGYREGLDKNLQEKIESHLLKVIQTSDWKIQLNSYGILNNQ